MAMRKLRLGALGALLLTIGCGGGGGSDDPPASTPFATVTATARPTEAPTATPTPAGIVAFVAGGFAAHRSVDEGASWQPILASQLPGGLQAVDFVDPATGWIVGGSHVYHTTTGGADASPWTDQRAGAADDADLYDVAFVDARRGVVVGGDPAAREEGRSRPLVLVTSDGGEAWRVADLGFLRRDLNTWLTGVCMTPAGRGIAVANRFTRSADSLILQTSDGGETWDDRTSAALLGPTSAVAAVSCANDGDFWLVGAPALLLASSDGGASWRRIPVAPSRRNLFLNAVAFADARNGWVAGYDEAVGAGFGEILVFATHDGGASWTERTLLRDVRILGSLPPVAIAPVDATTALLVGTDPNSFLEEGTRPFAFVTHDGGDTWTAGDVPTGEAHFDDLDVVR